MNIVDLYLSMVMCHRDNKDNIYFKAEDNSVKLIGVIKEHKIENNRLIIDIKSEPNVNIQFLDIQINLD